MITGFQSVWECTFGLIIVARDRIKLIEDNAEHILFAQYHTGPKRNEFEKVEIEKMLVQEVFNLIQTELAAPIVFAPLL